MKAYRENYIKELLAEPRHPINSTQTGSISFFPPDKSYAVWATFKRTNGATPFMIPTHSGKQKPFKEYGILTFSLGGAQYTLHAYQQVDMMDVNAEKDYLFIPFNDLTNYESTYGGGRYIDILLKEIDGDRVLLDFNKCYNPYCAYADGFSCPIPPTENHLPIEIRAGEKVFPR
jgi:uncharacterized protein (DUF1684 family)